MRHVYAYRVFYLLAALILGACALFAWIRSQDIAIGPESRNAVPNVHPAPAADHKGAGRLDTDPAAGRQVIQFVVQPGMAWVSRPV